MIEIPLVTTPTIITNRGVKKKIKLPDICNDQSERAKMASSKFDNGVSVYIVSMNVFGRQAERICWSNHSGNSMIIFDSYDLTTDSTHKYLVTTCFILTVFYKVSK